jgi:hypothetical protein
MVNINLDKMMTLNGPMRIQGTPTANQPRRWAGWVEQGKSQTMQGVLLAKPKQKNITENMCQAQGEQWAGHWTLHYYQEGQDQVSTTSSELANHGETVWTKPADQGRNG